jgi:hypothetical protein
MTDHKAAKAWAQTRKDYPHTDGLRFEDNRLAACYLELLELAGQVYHGDTREILAEVFDKSEAF